MEKIERRIGEIFSDGDNFILTVEFFGKPYIKCTLCCYLNYCRSHRDSFQICSDDRSDGSTVFFKFVDKDRGQMQRSMEDVKEVIYRQARAAIIVEHLFLLLEKVTKFIIKIKNKLK